MLTFRWDTLVVAATIGMMAVYLLIHALVRVNASRLFEALSLACDTAEPNLYELCADRRWATRVDTSTQPDLGPDTTLIMPSRRQVS